MRRKPLLSTEAINYQDTTTFKELELAFREMMYDQTKDQFIQNKRENEMRIEAIVKHRFNGNCSVHFGEEYPCVQMFDMYHNSVLVRNDHRELYAYHLNFTKRFIGSTGAKRGGVDIDKAKLTGLFSELPFTIYMPLSHMVKGGGVPEKFRFSSEETAAIFLHEVGHMFTYCEMFSRTVTTNMALSAMSKALDGTYSVPDREVIIGRCIEDLKLSDVDVTALASSGSTLIVETAIVTEVAEKSRTELGISIYDSTASEFLADQFATRFGAGRHLMTGLNKFVGLFGGENAHMSTPLFLFKNFVHLLTLFIPPINLIAIPVAIIDVLMGGLGDKGDHTYDTPELRFRRIKHETINRLKNRFISDEERKRTLADLADMEKAMEGIKDKRTWTEVVADTIIPVYYKYRKTKLLQQQLEQLANNPLFVRSAELATLI